MNVTGPINIYKVGDKIANKLFKALSEEQGQSKLGFIQIIVDNSVTIKSFNYYIDKGNMYTTVKLDKSGVFGYIAGIREDTIQFDRIPLQEYLRKVREGE
jgi:hypothetical protein